jgi:ketosteroid isomerase-like protein
MHDQTALVRELYRLFNARDMNAALAMLAPEVVWANGMEGGHVRGRAAVRDYWTRQWQMIAPSVEPQDIVTTPNGSLVTVHQIVHDLDGKLLADQIVTHRFELKDGLVERFDILERRPTSSA